MFFFAQQTDTLQPLKDQYPLVYIIVVGLIIAIGFLVNEKRIASNKINSLESDKDALHDSMLKIALSSTESVNEAFSLVEKMINQGNIDRKLAEQAIETHLLAIKEDVKTIKDEVVKQRGQK